MKFSTRTGGVEALRTGCLVIGIHEGNRLGSHAVAVDQACGGLLARLAKAGDLGTKPGDITMLHQPAGVAAERVAVVGLGDAEKVTDASYSKTVAAALRAVRGTAATSVTFALEGAAPSGRDASWEATQLAIAVGDATYAYQGAGAPKANDKKPALKEICFHAASAGDARAASEGLAIGSAIATGAALTKDLGNLPANICTPSYLAQQARKLGTEHKFKVEVLDRKEMSALGMNTLLSVAAGAAEPPKFIILKYLRGAAKASPIVLVGKGVTFDTGGISLKPAPEMDEMKFDMCGAASVLGAIKTAALLELPINLIGLVPATENMPGGRATRPGDVVVSMSGQSVEILNTDAEGRLILCDALTYAERFSPACVVDIATLTGACVIALGHVASGLLANDNELARELLDAGEARCDRAWQMPLWDEYQEQLKSNFADMANIGGRPAGTITAAAFLSRFTKKYPWAHLDVAGTANRSGKDKGATGRPVPLLAEFLVRQAAKSAPSPAPGRRRAKVK